ncbi:hypothetical protein R3P38DRAFT_3206759 [Favolaschia claudopus]|uniref:Uncharacterized protein n=1 Tax=Favolaschia claudopus TaxID=2862362 RepID=A0AAW0AKL5_9AGAR
MSSPKGEVSPDITNYFSPNTSSVLDIVSHRLHHLPLSSHSLKRQPSTGDAEHRNKIAKMGDVNMLDNLHKHLVSVVSSTYSVLGWAAEHIKFNQTDEVVKYVEKNEGASHRRRSTITLDAPTPGNGAGGNGFNNSHGRGNAGFSRANRAGGSYGRYAGNNRGNGNGRGGARFAFD